MSCSLYNLVPCWTSAIFRLKNSLSSPTSSFFNLQFSITNFIDYSIVPKIARRLSSWLITQLIVSLFKQHFLTVSICFFEFSYFTPAFLVQKSIVRVKNNTIQALKIMIKYKEYPKKIVYEVDPIRQTPEKRIQNFHQASKF